MALQFPERKQQRLLLVKAYHNCLVFLYMNTFLQFPEEPCSVGISDVAGLGLGTERA